MFETPLKISDALTIYTVETALCCDGTNLTHRHIAIAENIFPFLKEKLLKLIKLYRQTNTLL